MIKCAAPFLTLFFLYLCPLFAADLQCTSRIAEQFFPLNITTKALSLYDIPQSQWTPINNELKKISGKMRTLLESKASLLSPNPFHSENMQLEAFVIMREVLFEQFALAVRQMFYADDDTLRQMFVYISMQHLAELKLCFGKEIFENPQRNP